MESDDSGARLSEWRWYAFIVKEQQAMFALDIFFGGDNKSHSQTQIRQWIYRVQ